MKKHILLFLMVIAVVMLTAVPVSNLGNIRVPNAYVMPSKMVVITYNNYFAANDFRDPSTAVSGSLGPDRSHKYDYYWAGMANVGIMNRAEVGVVGSGDNVVYGNVKLKLLEETVKLPAISAGVDNLFSRVPNNVNEDAQTYNKWAVDEKIFEPDMYERNSMFLALTKSSVIRGMGFSNYLEMVFTAGFGTNRFTGQNEITHKLKGIFTAIELKPQPNMSIIGEMDGYNINLGFKYGIKNFAAQVSLLQAEQFQSQRIGLDLSYTFDKYVTSKRPNVLFGLESGKQEFAGRRTVTTPEELKQSNELVDELKVIRDKREQAEKELEEIKKILQDQE